MVIETGALDPDASPAPGTSATDSTAVSSTADVDKGSSPEAQTSVDNLDAGSDGNPKPEEKDYSTELLEAVTKAANGESTDDSDGTDNADKTGAEGKTAATDKTGGAGAKQAEDEANVESDDPADYADEPFGKHPRFKAVLKQRAEFREQLAQSQQQLQAFKPRAEQFDKMDSFVREHGISAQEVTEAFRIMALVKSDPAAARQVMAEHLARLDEFTGHKLPPDLEKDVQDGVITEQHARELSRARSQERFTGQRMQQTQQRLEQERQEAHQQRQAEHAKVAATARMEAVRKVESQLLAEDPDYKRLQPWVIRELKAQMAALPPEKKPQTPDAAVALFNAALATVRRDLRELSPRKPEVRPTATTAHGGATPSAQKQPETLLDAVLQAAAQPTG